MCERLLRWCSRKLVKDPTKTHLLDNLWQEHRSQEDEHATRPPSDEDSPSALKGKSSPNGQPPTRNRAVSSASALAPPGQTLSAHHPALSLPTYLDTFGPLVFPLYKAALLRKRVLLISHAPVELACHFGEFLPHTTVWSSKCFAVEVSDSHPSSRRYSPSVSRQILKLGM